MTIASYGTVRNTTTRNGTCASWKRTTKATPCAVCGAKKYCEYTDDGWLHCFDEAKARALGGRPWDKRNGGFLIAPENRPARTMRLLPSQPAPAPLPSSDNNGQAGADTLHAVYASLLELCPLMRTHGELLTGSEHGLTAEQARRYGTLPRNADKACAELERRHGRATLLSVPGFTEQAGRLSIRGAGIIMPTRDVQGRITAMDVRRERPAPDEAKYFKLSSGTVGGPSSGTPAHVARPRELRDARTVYVTEGVKKADVAADALGCYVIGVVGHNTWRHALPALDALAEEGAIECIIALDRDADPKTVAKVDPSRQQLAAAAAELGYAVRLAVWDASAAKGLDDLLQAGLTPMRERYRPVLAAGDEHTQLAAENKALRGRFRDVTRLLTMPHMKPTDKVLSHAAWAIANQYPSDGGDEQRPLVRANRDYIACYAGVSEATVTKALPDLAALRDAPIRREVHYDRATGRSELWIGGGRLPEAAWTEDELQSKGRAKDRARKVCPQCGSTHLAVHSYICEDCNALSTPEEAGRAGEAAAEAQEAKAHRVTVDGRVIDSETGEILQVIAASEPSTSAAPVWDTEAATTLIGQMLQDVGAVAQANGENETRPGFDALDERIDAACEAHDWDSLVRQVNAVRALYGLYDAPRRCPCDRMTETDCAGECPFNRDGEVRS